MYKITFIRQFLKINGEDSIILPLPIEGMIQLQDMVIVLIGSTSEDQMEKLKGSNVYAFDCRSKELWKIKSSPAIDNRIYPYSDISLKKSGEIVAGNVMGAEYLVNLADGNIKPYGSGRPW